MKPGNCNDLSDKGQSPEPNTDLLAFHVRSISSGPRKVSLLFAGPLSNKPGQQEWTSLINMVEVGRLVALKTANRGVNQIGHPIPGQVAVTGPTKVDILNMVEVVGLVTLKAGVFFWTPS